MKKTIFYVFLFSLTLTFSAFGQARKELNFGLIGANLEFPVHKDVTIAPGVATNFSLDWASLHVKGNYYFDNLFGIKDNAWDVYGGAVAGYSIYTGDLKALNKSDLDLGLHVGGRWFWNDKWGLYLELGGGSTSGAIGGIGLTVKL